MGEYLECHNHGQEAMGRCYTCHRPYCDDCDHKEGCCSIKCYSSKVRFAGVEARRPAKWGPRLVKLTVLVAAGGAAYFFWGTISGWLEGLF